MQAIEGTRPVKIDVTAAVNKSAAIKWWAAVGAFFLVIQIYAYARWVTGPYFKRVGSGPDAIPLAMRITADSAEIVSMTLLVFGLYRYVVKPWRGERRLSALGMIWVTAITIYWLSWSTDWVVESGNWTGAFWFNKGAWYCYIPGWVSPNGCALREFSSFGVPITVVWFGLGSMFMCGVLRKVKSRYPRMSAGTLIAVAIGTAFCLDLLVEPTLMLGGLWAYHAGIPSLNLFSGHYFQFPIYESLLMAPLWGLPGALLYFTDDRGRTFVERGTDQLRMSPKSVSVLRFCAFSGFLNLLMILYTLGWIFVSVQPSFQENKAVVGKRSYFIEGICGPRTDVACPVDRAPIPRGDGNIHFDPNGNLVKDGKILDKMPPQRQVK